ncbi:hypothetical protein llap_8622 [Limosa lapponica baueri]|uniref:Peptidase S1 domain-containing protein n=1 Tax=Limosa lapponica baueri TaxID=1758121 RepID=A0A2I0U4U1_LIMLA|nr:hypothetical protein llap_8622 [Limosa lapponica baueri]
MSETQTGPDMKGSTKAENTVMKHLQKLLLSLLLVTWPSANADYCWNWMEGGGKAKEPSAPYVVYLQGRNKQFCGGFLVAPNWVMTAAQCSRHKPLTVILETHTIQESWQKFQVQEYHPHPGFRNPKEGNDILLLKSDAGNPLTCKNKVYGIFSYRQKNWPGFYTHIAPYLPWINSVMKS